MPATERPCQCPASCSSGKLAMREPVAVVAFAWVAVSAPTQAAARGLPPATSSTPRRGCRPRPCSRRGSHRQRHSRRHGLELEPRALARRPARDDLEVERERVGHDLAQVADALAYVHANGIVKPKKVPKIDVPKTEA